MKGDWPNLEQMSRDSVIRVTDELTQLAHFGPRWDSDRREGICALLNKATNHGPGRAFDKKYLQLELTAQFQNWPKFSGILNYPVPVAANELPSDIYGMSSVAQFQYLQRNRMLWRDKQGALRRELSYYLLENFSDYVKYTLT
jgi:hypothetical protein